MNRTPLQDVHNMTASRGTEKWATTVTFSPAQAAEEAVPEEAVASDTLDIELKPFAPKEVINFGEVRSTTVLSRRTIEQTLPQRKKYGPHGVQLSFRVTVCVPWSQVMVGESKIMTLKLSAPPQEDGSKPIACSIQRIKTHFAVELDSMELTVEPASDVLVPVRWTPAQGGAVSGSLLSIKWGFNGVQVNLVGTALEAASSKKKKVNYKGPKKPLVVRKGGNRLRAKTPAAKPAQPTLEERWLPPILDRGAPACYNPRTPTPAGTLLRYRSTRRPRLRRRPEPTPTAATLSSPLSRRTRCQSRKRPRRPSSTLPAATLSSRPSRRVR